jgi:hypothetical protein
MWIAQFGFAVHIRAGMTKRYPVHGMIGIAMIVLMETAVLSSQLLSQNSLWRVTMWATPVLWWGYILALDAWIYRRKGASLLSSRRETFVLECILSIAFWCLFEAYNRLMPGWRYINLIDDLPVRFVGYAVSFATIMPAMFLTCELLKSFGVFAGVRTPPAHWSKAALVISIVMGALFCILPPFLPLRINGYLWPFVWTGFFFLLEPFNYWRGVPSIYRDWERGSLTRTLQLFATGAICGVLWEFWNAWAYTKWVYVFPAARLLHIFEMPLVGFLGFLPFALEYFVMFHFLASFFTREDKLGL